MKDNEQKEKQKKKSRVIVAGQKYVKESGQSRQCHERGVAHRSDGKTCTAESAEASTFETNRQPIEHPHQKRGQFRHIDGGAKLMFKRADHHSKKNNGNVRDGTTNQLLSNPQKDARRVRKHFCY